MTTSDHDELLPECGALIGPEGESCGVPKDMCREHRPEALAEPLKHNAIVEAARRVCETAMWHPKDGWTTRPSHVRMLRDALVRGPGEVQPESVGLTEHDHATHDVLDRILTNGFVENHGHRKRGTGCDMCRALYRLADASGFDLDAPGEQRRRERVKTSGGEPSSGAGASPVASADNGSSGHPRSQTGKPGESAPNAGSARRPARHPYERGQLVEVRAGKRAGERYPVLDIYFAYEDDERPGVSIRDGDTELFYGLDEVRTANPIIETIEATPHAELEALARLDEQVPVQTWLDGEATPRTGSAFPDDYDVASDLVERWADVFGADVPARINLTRAIVRLLRQRALAAPCVSDTGNNEKGEER